MASTCRSSTRLEVVCTFGLDQTRPFRLSPGVGLGKIFDHRPFLLIRQALLICHAWVRSCHDTTFHGTRAMYSIIEDYVRERSRLPHFISRGFFTKLRNSPLSVIMILGANSTTLAAGCWLAAGRWCMRVAFRDLS